MEHLEYRFKMEGEPLPCPSCGVLVGVVASGNLEVLVESAPGMECEFIIETAAHGFGPTWQAVLNDFIERTAPVGLRFSINDYAAGPDVVSLRLDQALEIVKRETLRNPGIGRTV